MFQLIVGLLPIPNLVFGISKYKSAPPYLKALIWFVGFQAFIEIGGNFIGEILHKSNLYWYNLYIVFSLLFIASIFYLYTKRRALRLAIVIVAVGYTLFALYNYFYLEGMNVFNSLSITAECLIVICLSLAVLINAFYRANILHLERYGMFWIAAGLLYYHASGLFLYMYGSYLFVEDAPVNLQGYYNTINTINILIFHSMIFIAIWTGQKQPKLIPAS